ncbi:hypothetical protein ACHAXA_006707, partial [Cyclostephanos tholiformis]
RDRIGAGRLPIIINATFDIGILGKDVNLGISTLGGTAETDLEKSSLASYSASAPFEGSKWHALSTRIYSAQPLQEEEDAQLITPSIADARRNHLRADEPKIGRLVLVRHGQSEWNVTDPSRNLTARFTGWADIGLTQQGKDQALAAGKAIRLAMEMGLIPSKDRTDLPAIDVVFCSLLRRASDTMNIILEEICLAEKIIGPSLQGKGASKEVRPKYQYPIPIIQSWRLNERHYGALVGLSKEGAERLYGRIRLTRWRDSWDVPPPPMPLEMVKRWGREDHCQPVTIVRVGDGGRTCIFDPAALGMQNLHSSKVSQGSGVRIVEHGGRRRQGIPAESSGPESKDKIIDDATFMPPSESLRDAYERFLPLWIQGIAPHIRAGRTVLVVAHANTIRSILFAIDGEIATKENAKKVKIPSALPLIYEFVDNSGFVGLEKFDEFSGDFSGRRNEAAVGISKPTCPTYVFNGQVCSAVVPGNLRLLKPSVNTATKDANEDFRYRLNGRWVETAETKSASFCTDLGKAMGEQDIA